LSKYKKITDDSNEQGDTFFVAVKLYYGQPLKQIKKQQQHKNIESYYFQCSERNQDEYARYNKKPDEFIVHFPAGKITKVGIPHPVFLK
jgi:hypothetical protein